MAGKGFFNNLTIVSRLLLVVLVVGIVYLGVTYGEKVYDYASKYAAPKSKAISSVEITPQAKKAVKEGIPKLTVAINTWGGYAPGILYNKGYGASTNSRYFTEQGILVEFVVMEDPGNMRAAWRKGDIQVFGLATVDSEPAEINELMDMKPKMFHLVDYSRGGDVAVVTREIRRAKDLEGKRVALLPKSPSHTLLLVWCEADGADPKKITIVPTLDGIIPSQEFKGGAVPGAIMWAPTDDDAINGVPGSHRPFSTKKAAWAVADVFITSEQYTNKNAEVLKKFLAGWFKAAAEMNSSESAREEAAKLMPGPMAIKDETEAMGMIKNARLCTYGDNLQFFGLVPGGITGEEIYNKMYKLYRDAGVIKEAIPAWRQVADSSLVASLKLTGKEHDPEAPVKFTAATAEEQKAPAFAQKPAPIHFAFNSWELNEDAKIMIDTYFVLAAKSFRNARVRIEGNTDNVGSAAINRTVSYNRANAVGEYLTKKYGFDRTRFVIVGNGFDKPVPGCETNATEEMRAKNRRTEFALLE
jgi:NitT/TauT family transport system substrate-binding protein